VLHRRDDTVLAFARGKINVDKLVQEAVASGKPLSKAAQSYALRNASVDDLLKLPRTEAVYEAILKRPEASATALRESLRGLAEQGYVEGRGFTIEYRSAGDEAQAESVLRAALRSNAKDASLHYSLGLALVRQQRNEEALRELQQAARLAPEQPHYTYVYGVALHSKSSAAQGVAVLTEAHKRFPGDMEILQALATMERDRGQIAAARRYAQQLVDLTPEDPQAQALLRAMSR
jgi:Flp pilus assembly protein TadD